MAKQAVNKYNIGDTVFYMENNSVKTGAINGIVLVKEAYLYRLTNTNDIISFGQFIKEELLFPTKEALIKSL